MAAGKSLTDGQTTIKKKKFGAFLFYFARWHYLCTIPLHAQMNQPYPSQLLERAVSEFSRLPSIGRKTALRLVLHLLRQPEEDVEQFASAVLRMKQEVKYCAVCHNISDTEVCPFVPIRGATSR